MPDVEGVQRGQVVRHDGRVRVRSTYDGFRLCRVNQEIRADVQRRTAVERVNARLKVFWGVDDGNLTGSRRFVAQVGVVGGARGVRDAVGFGTTPRGNSGQYPAQPYRRGPAIKATATPLKSVVVV